MTHQPDTAIADEAALLAALQDILLRADRARLDELEAVLRQRIDAVDADNTAAIRALEDALATLRAEALDDQTMMARLAPMLSDLISRQIRNNRAEMAEALGPVMGEAIRVQIRDSRKDMIDALYPVIGATVQRALAEFARELQRNIDARLRRTVNIGQMLSQLGARLRGVSASELALRNALPFEILEVFLIQTGSGLLMAHYSPTDTDTADSDLVSAMLTAIRDFAQDSFAASDEDGDLDEVQFGERRILIDGDDTAYVAVVIDGVEPEGFRARLRDTTSQLTLKHRAAFSAYQGDPASLPEITPHLATLASEAGIVPEAPAPAPLKPIHWAAIGAGGLGLVGLTAIACFYLQFTLALYPLAFGPSPTPSLPPVATATVPPSPSATTAPSVTLSPSPTPSVSASASPSASATATASPSATPLPRDGVQAIIIGNVWLRATPSVTAPVNTVLLQGTVVSVLAVDGEWALVQSPTQTGWLPSRWLSSSPVTPTGTPLP